MTTTARTIRGSVLITSAWAVALTVAGGVARADVADECVAAHAESQRLRHAGKLREAHEKLLVCSRLACPRMVRSECGGWVSEVEALQSSVVFGALDAAGHDLTDVHVMVDGQMLVDHLDGSALDLDPGPHHLRFEHGGRGIEQDIVLREGERARQIVVQFPGGPSQLPVTTPSPEAPKEPEGRPSRPIPVWSFVLGGAAVAAAAVGITFYVLGFTEEKSLEAQGCSPRCLPSSTSEIKTRYRVGDILVGTGIVSASASVVVYLTRPKRTKEGVSAFLVPTEGGAALGAEGHF
jgi:hypothetical protein